MVTISYIVFALIAAVLGSIAGLAAHFWRATAAIVPEDLGLGETISTFTRDNYQWEKHVVGAEWDDNGYWDAGSVRNLLYYMITGGVTPLIVAVALFGQRQDVVALICHGLSGAGLHSPLCPA